MMFDVIGSRIKPEALPIKAGKKDREPAEADGGELDFQQSLKQAMDPDGKKNRQKTLEDARPAKPMDRNGEVEAVSETISAVFEAVVKRLEAAKATDGDVQLRSAHELIRASLTTEKGADTRKKIPGALAKSFEKSHSAPGRKSADLDVSEDPELGMRPAAGSDGDEGGDGRKAAAVKAEGQGVVQRVNADKSLPSSPQQAPQPAHDLPTMTTRDNDLARPMQTQSAQMQSREAQQSMNPQRTQPYAHRDMIRIERTSKGARAAMELQIGDGKNLDLKLLVEDGIARIVMTSNSPEMDNWLHKSAEQIARSLAAAGVEVDGVDVETSDRDPDDPQHGSAGPGADTEEEATVETVWLDALPSKIHIVA